MNKENQTDLLSCDIKKHSIQKQIDHLLDCMTLANVIETMNQVGALTVKLRVLKPETDFTRSNQMDWGVRVFLSPRHII